MCLTWEGTDVKMMVLRSCDVSNTKQIWMFNQTTSQLIPGGCGTVSCCMQTSAKSQLDLRTDVTVGYMCGGVNATWIYEAKSGHIQSGVGGTSNAASLCLAARSVGVYNQWA